MDVRPMAQDRARGAAKDPRFYGSTALNDSRWEPWPLRSPSPGPAVILQKLPSSPSTGVSSE